MTKQPLRKILFVSGSLQPGGAELHLLKLLRGLCRLNIECHVVCFSGGVLESEYDATGAVMHLVDRGQGSFSRKLYRVFQGLRDVVDEVQPDVIHSQLPQTNILTCYSTSKYDIPIVLSERGLGKTRSIWEKVFRKRAYSRADFIITNSSATVARIIGREKIPPDRVELINNIIDIESNRQARSNQAKHPDEKRNRLSIISVGGLRDVKGFDVLIKAMRLLLDRGVSADLTIAGEGPERANLEGLISELDLSERVNLLGYTEDVSSVLSKSDVFVSSSYSEGQSNAILEAMALGVPVIATAVGGSVSLLGNGEAGFLVSPGNPQAIAVALEVVLESEKEVYERKEIAYQRIQDNHSTEAILGRYLRVYDSILNHDKGQ